MKHWTFASYACSEHLVLAMNAIRLLVGQQDRKPGQMTMVSKLKNLCKALV